MRIAPKDTLLGHSILKVREVIRMAMKEQLSAFKKEDIIEFISDKLALSIPVGKKLFRDLISEGYLVQAPVKLTTLRRFKLTTAGRCKLTTISRSKLTT